MKRKIYTVFGALLLLAACSKGEMPDYQSAPQDSDKPASGELYTAIVTQKCDAQGKVFFQLDDENIAYPTNFDGTYTGLRRLICKITLSGSTCYLHWMDYLTEAPFVASATIPDDGLELLDDWMTSVEDGFLTVHYRSWWGDGSTPHSLEVVQGEHPYELYLRHSRNGDEALSEADALVYFDINSLPSTEGDYVYLTLNWTTGEGTAASKQFRFRSRQ